MKTPIDAFEYAGKICQSLKNGVLLTTKAGDIVNTMTIGWGKIGIEWNRPVFIAYVRESRYTRELLDHNGEFTVNIPIEKQDTQTLTFCGRTSGRDMNKIQHLGLILVDSDKISVPGIQQFPLTLECRVIYRQVQDLAAIDDTLLQRFYPVEPVQGKQDVHIAYYGEIVNAYLIEA